MNNDLFLTRAQPELKTCCYFALMSYVTTNYNSYQVENCENDSKTVKIIAKTVKIIAKTEK